MKSQALSLSLLLVPMAAGSVVNFEDVGRLHARHADCRLMHLQEWHQGHHYDLANVTRQFDVQRAESSLLERLYNITAQQQQQLQHQQEQRSQMVHSTNNSNATLQLDQGHQDLLRYIGNLTRSQEQLRSSIQKDTSHEAELQQRLDQCANSTSQNQLIDTLQSLIYSRSNSRTNSIIRRYFMEHRLFSFTNLTAMWSQFWQQIRHIWSQRWQMTEAQEWSGLQKMIRTGEATVSQSEVWRSDAHRFLARMHQWLHLNCTQQIQFLTERSILRGQGVFGFLVSQAGEFGVSGPTGSAFSLRQFPPTPCFLRTEGGLSQQRDLYVLTAERLVPRDLRSRIHAAVYGSGLRRDGRQYAFNATTGQYALTADANLHRMHNLTGTTEALLSGMDPATGQYWNQGSQYFEHYQQWWNLYHNQWGSFDQQSSVFTSSRGYYNWRTGQFYRAFGWHDYAAQVYRTSHGWYDPSTRLYHTQIPQSLTWSRPYNNTWSQENASANGGWRNIAWRARQCDGRGIKQNAPPAIVLRPPSP